MTEEQRPEEPDIAGDIPRDEFIDEIMEVMENLTNEESMFTVDSLAGVTGMTDPAETDMVADEAGYFDTDEDYEFLAEMLEEDAEAANSPVQDDWRIMSCFAVRICDTPLIAQHFTMHVEREAAADNFSVLFELEFVVGSQQELDRLTYTTFKDLSIQLIMPTSSGLYDFDSITWIQQNLVVGDILTFKDVAAEILSKQHGPESAITKLPTGDPSQVIRSIQFHATFTGIILLEGTIRRSRLEHYDYIVNTALAAADANNRRYMPAKRDPLTHSIKTTGAGELLDFGAENSFTYLPVSYNDYPTRQKTTGLRYVHMRRQLPAIPASQPEPEQFQWVLAKRDGGPVLDMSNDGCLVLSHTSNPRLTFNTQQDALRFCSDIQVTLDLVPVKRMRPTAFLTATIDVHYYTSGVGITDHGWDISRSDGFALVAIDNCYAYWAKESDDPQVLEFLTADTANSVIRMLASLKPRILITSGLSDYDQLSEARPVGFRYRSFAAKMRQRAVYVEDVEPDQVVAKLNRSIQLKGKH